MSRMHVPASIELEREMRADERLIARLVAEGNERHASRVRSVASKCQVSAADAELAIERLDRIGFSVDRALGAGYAIIRAAVAAALAGNPTIEGILGTGPVAS